MTRIGHFVALADQKRIKCDCGKPATVCLYNEWKIASRTSGISFWYHCAGCAKRILYRERAR